MEKHDKYYLINLLDERKSGEKPQKRTFLVSMQNLQQLHAILEKERKRKMDTIEEHPEYCIGIFNKSIQPSMLEMLIKQYLAGNKDVTYLNWPFITRANISSVSELYTFNDYVCKDEDGTVVGGFKKLAFRVCSVENIPFDSVTNEFDYQHLMIEEMYKPYYIHPLEGDKISIDFTEDTVPEFVITQKGDMRCGKSYFGFQMEKNVSNSFYRVLQELGALI